MGAHHVEKDFACTLWDHLNGQTTKAYWVKCQELTEGIWKQIDWESISHAMQELPIHHQHCALKYISGHFSMGKNMQRWQFQSSVQCPRCSHPLEDKEHVLTCLDIKACKKWELSLKQLDDWLKSEGTNSNTRT